MEFSHLDEFGKAKMVDVTEKPVTKREAVASGIISMNEETFTRLNEGTIAKGDVLSVAKVAGIIDAKRTSELIPLCHPLRIGSVNILFEKNEDKNQIKAVCKVTGEDKSGFEMEALTGVSTALLTIYDMCKAVDKMMVISDIKLDYKSGGKSGEFVRDKC